MKLKYKINLMSLGILMAVACAIAAAGVVAINRVTYDLNRRLMTKEVDKLITTVRGAHQVLKESGVASVESYIQRAQADLLAEFGRYQYGATGRLVVVEKPDVALLDYSSGESRSVAHPFLAEMIHKVQGSMEGPCGPQMCFFTFGTYPEWNWLVILSVTTEEMLEMRSRFLGNVVLILQVSLVLGSALILWFTSRIVKPIRQLVVAADCVSRGEWDTPLPVPASKDEVAQLTIAFRDMSVKQAAAYRNLQENLKTIGQSQEALRKSEERFRSLVETTSDWVWELDQNAIYTYASPKVRDLLGYEPEELIGKTPLYVVHSDVVTRVTEMFQTIVQSRETFLGLEKTCRHKDGRLVVLETSGVPFFDENGTFCGYRGIDRDITERKTMEEELLKAQKLESIGILAGGIAHDFNNILTAITGNLSIAKIHANPGGRLYGRLEETERACFRARDLTQQLLTFSKGGDPLRKTRSISRLIKDVVTFALRGSNIRCEFSIPDDLWPVEVDEGQISQVVNNLIVNAHQAMPEGGTIRVHAENLTVGATPTASVEPGRSIRLSFQDTGVGIPKEVLPKVFDPYFTTKENGSGLGLATAYSIINKHDGHIIVESELGLGTTFHVVLPASEEEIQPLVEVEESPLAGRGRVLVMDDEDFVREALGEMLSYLGYEAAFARDGVEAIAKYQESSESGECFDAVILDLTIAGGMGGKQAIKRLLEIDPQVKGIVSSGYSNDPVMADYKKHGFVGVVSKPYRLEELSRSLHEVIAEATR